MVQFLLIQRPSDGCVALGEINLGETSEKLAPKVGLKYDTDSTPHLRSKRSDKTRSAGHESWDVVYIFDATVSEKILALMELTDWEAELDIVKPIINACRQLFLKQKSAP